MTVHGKKVKMEKGFDVVKRGKVVEHCKTYEEARKVASVKRGVVRYWVDLES